MFIGKLPDGWVEVSLDEIAHIEMGQSPSSDSYNINGIGLPFYQGKTEFGQMFPQARKWCSSPLKTAEPNDILLSVRAPVGAVNIVQTKSAIGRGIAAIRTTHHTNYLYLYYYFRSIEPWLSQQGTGSIFAAIGGQFIQNIKVPLPPLNEQNRIVEKIENILSKLNTAQNELNIAKKKLEQYRRSLIKNAVTGELSKDWREACKPSVVEKSGKKLLEDILREKRKKWECKQLVKFSEQKSAPSLNWQDKYPEPIKPNLQDLFELPESWTWASLDMLGEIVSGITKSSNSNVTITHRTVPYLRVANVQRGYLDLSEVKLISASEKDIKALALQYGDILFNEGGDLDKLGRGWVWHNELEECIHQNHVYRLRPYLLELQSELISHYTNTLGQSWFQDKGKQTTNLASINLTILKSFPIPIASFSEQKKILQLLSAFLEGVDKQYQLIENTLQLTKNQQRNVLQRAVKGELLPQSKSDLPANTAFQLIKTEIEILAKRKISSKVKLNNFKTGKSMRLTVLEVLTGADDWISGEALFQLCGIGNNASIEQIEQIYYELRELDQNNQLEIKPNDPYFKTDDLIRLKDNKYAA